MNRNICFLSLILLANSINVCAKEITGKVFCGKKGISDVVVTDGVNFTITDSLGNYKIDTDTSLSDFVYVVTPSGYVASYSTGTPCFYKSVSAKKHDFELFEFSVPQGRYTMFAVGDTQPGNDIAYQRMENEAIPDLKNYGEEFTKRSIPVAAILLGDLVWDNQETYGRLKNDLKSLGYPVYPVIGNHDHEEYFSDNKKSELVYKEFFGPNYYAFNMGCDYYIVLDNIDYKGNRKYDERITTDQLQWVKKYVEYIPKGSHVFVAMHAPAYIYYLDKTLEGAEELMDILNDYEVSILTGHTHIHSNILLRSNVREHMVASIGGAWWLGECKYAYDGTPMGYKVFESTPLGLKWHYKTLGMPRDYQMKIYSIGTFPGHVDELCVKVWDWDEGWKVEWKEDGKYKGEMKSFSSVDPDYTMYVSKSHANGTLKSKGTAPQVNDYCFFSVKPSKGVKTVEIIVTDRFGSKYSNSVEIE